jgi:hypothetical protein
MFSYNNRIAYYRESAGSMKAILSTRSNKRKRTGNGKEGKITFGIIVSVTLDSRYKFFLRIVIVHFNLSPFIVMQLINEQTNG